MSLADPLAGLTMSYDGLVEAGRAAREQADNVQWTEGDLALQVEHLPLAERPRDPETGAFLVVDEHALKQYAVDIDLPYRTLQEYRRVAVAWPQDHRARGVAWRTHAELAGQDDRFDLIHEAMTTREAAALVGKRNSASRGKPGWFELLGEVGDTLVKARKQLAKAEDAIEDPSDELRVKAEQYAEWADEIARRLRAVA